MVTLLEFHPNYTSFSFPRGHFSSTTSTLQMVELRYSGGDSAGKEHLQEAFADLTVSTSITAASSDICTKMPVILFFKCMLQRAESEASNAGTDSTGTVAACSREKFANAIRLFVRRASSILYRH